jgi:pimeloyl-ACP methyl ester carboxylesterase
LISGPPSTSKGRAASRRVLYPIAAALLLILALISLLYFRQHAMIYHPRPYDASYAHGLPPNGIEINYTLLGGKQTAFYIPGAEPLPKRLWVAFCGNGSLALDWTTILAGYPNNGDAFLLIDYPGYGKNSGYATIESTRASSEAALQALTERLQIGNVQLDLGTIGHSLGAAVAFDFAAFHNVQRVVAIAPFTTLREEAATVVGRPLSNLLIENYDNRANLATITKRHPETRIAIFHGENDGVVPFELGRKLAREFPTVEFFPISGAGHVSVLTQAREKIIDWMNR